MLKQLYFSFLIYGFFLLIVLNHMWGLTEPADVYTYLNVGCGFVLSCIASILSLYKQRFSAILGGVCMVVTAPMFIESSRAIGLSAGFFTPLLLISLMAYILGIVNIIKVFLKRIRPEELNRKTKIALAILPFAFLIILGASDYYRF